MGRLSKKQLKRTVKKVAKQWGLPAIISFTLIFGLHSTIFASQNPSMSDLIDYLETNQLEVGQETINGYSQVYYQFRGKKFFITDGSTNHYDARSSGRYVVWVQESPAGSGRIVLYDVVSEATAMITHTGSSRSPLLAGDHVVWQGWVDNRWQVFYYNGQETIQISSGDPSTRAQFNGQEIVYSQQGADGIWRVQHYDTLTKETSTIYEGEGKDAWPHFEGNEIKVEFYDQLGR